MSYRQVNVNIRTMITFEDNHLRNNPSLFPNLQLRYPKHFHQIPDRNNSLRHLPMGSVQPDGSNAG